MQMTPHAQTRQMPEPRGIAYLRDAYVQERRRGLAIK